MPTPPHTTRFRAPVLALLCFAVGVAGTVIGRIYGTAPGTLPAWVGPAILIVALACFVAGLLLLPAAIRAVRAPGPKP